VLLIQSNLTNEPTDNLQHSEVENRGVVARGEVAREDNCLP